MAVLGDSTVGKKRPVLKLQKVIFQARYKPDLGTYSRLAPAAKKLEYPHWETDRLTITVRDFEKRCSVVLRSNQFAYDQDSSDTDMEKGQISAAVNLLPDELGIGPCSRLGYRRIYLLPVTMSFTRLVQILELRLLSQDDKLRRTMPDAVSDMQYVVDAAEGDYYYHIRIGPLREEEIPSHVSFTKRHHLDPANKNADYAKVLKGYPKVAILFDIDIYREGGDLPVSSADDFVSYAREDVEQRVQELAAYLLHK